MYSFFAPHSCDTPPQRYALMLTPAEARRLDQKYDERRGAITDMMLARHLASAIALAAPTAMDGCAHLLPLDIDTSGIAAIRGLTAEARRRDLWAFGQYCPRAGPPEQDQRGYVWLPFTELADAGRLQLLGHALISAVLQDGWKVEPRAHAAVTRLPMACHAHTRRYGQLVVSDQVIDIDADPAGALAALRWRYRENPTSSLPAPPHLLHNPSRSRKNSAHSQPIQASRSTATTRTTT
jgi:hypothetical protein